MHFVPFRWWFFECLWFHLDAVHSHSSLLMVVQSNLHTFTALHIRLHLGIQLQCYYILFSSCSTLFCFVHFSFGAWGHYIIHIFIWVLQSLISGSLDKGKYSFYPHFMLHCQPFESKLQWRGKSFHLSMLSSQEMELTAAFVVIIIIVFDIIIVIVIITIVFNIIILGLIVIIALEIFIVIVIIFNCGASSSSSSSLTPSAELLSRLWWVNSKSQANQLQISFYFFLLFLN